MSFLFYPWAPALPQVIMQILCIIAFVYLLYKYKLDTFFSLVIVLCFPRVFDFFGTNMGNMYKIFILLFTIFVAAQRKVWKVHTSKDIFITFAFLLFSIQYFIAVYFYSHNTFTIIFSQYSRYVEIYLLFFLLKEAALRRGQSGQVVALLYDIVLVNIIVSIAKYLLFGKQIESLVGTFTIIGGAAGTALPICGFLVLWAYRQGNKFTWKDWLYVAGLLVIGFTTGKRAIMFILPLLVAAFFVYVQRIRLNKYIVFALCMVPLLLYFGVRLTPALNPENRVWGSFNLDYAFDYAERYQFGEKGLEGQQEHQINYSAGGYNIRKPIKAEGRGGATIALVRLILSEQALTDQDLWGMGFKSMYGVDYETFDNLPLTIQINHKGSSTGFFQSYVTTGVLGAFFTILFSFLPLLYCKHKRVRLVLLALCFWEYFLYTGLLFRYAHFMVMIYALIWYLNAEYYQSKQQRNNDHIAVK